MEPYCQALVYHSRYNRCSSYMWYAIQIHKTIPYANRNTSRYCPVWCKPSCHGNSTPKSRSNIFWDVYHWAGSQSVSRYMQYASTWTSSVPDFRPLLSRLITIGLTKQLPELNKALGLSKTWGYHSDDGAIYLGNSTRQFCTYETYTEGDIVGCGIDNQKQLFFTKNGKKLGKELLFTQLLRKG